MAEKERFNGSKCRAKNRRNTAELEELAAREDAIQYLRHGFNLYEEQVRNSFTDDAAVAEFVVIRCEEFICGLSFFYHAVPWPKDVCLIFQEVFGNFESVFRDLLSDLTSLMTMTTVIILARLKRKLEDFQVYLDFSSQNSNLKVYVHCIFPGKE